MGLEKASLLDGETNPNSKAPSCEELRAEIDDLNEQMANHEFEYDRLIDELRNLNYLIGKNHTNMGPQTLIAAIRRRLDKIILRYAKT